jgi:hypothetical protein
MSETTKNDREQFKFILNSLKVLIVFGPLILVALIRVLALEGSFSVCLIEIGYAGAFFVLISFGIRQLSIGLRRLAYSNFIFAGVALIWILIFRFLFPILAST